MGDDELWWGWWTEQKPDRPAGDIVLDALRSGWLEVPLPGRGETSRRLAALARWSRSDPQFAAIAAGHAAAVAILAELGGPAPSGRLWGVWTDEADSVKAVLHHGGWALSGVRYGCAGVEVCERALVTAATGTGNQLFAIDVADTETLPLDGIHLNATRGTPVGGVGAYVSRPGYGHGLIDEAAARYGEASAAGQALLQSVGNDPDPEALEHLGAVDVALHSAYCLLADAATAVDADPAAVSPRLAMRVRLGVNAAAAVVEGRLARAVRSGVRGPGADREALRVLGGLVRDGAGADEAADDALGIERHVKSADVDPHV
jgi:hypothetical protein